MKRIKNKMKLLLAIVIIFSFQSWTKADDIKEFEIEGISIGDSALNFFSEKEIIDNLSISKTLKGSNFKRACFNNFGNLYDRICVEFKIGNEKTIHGLQGQIRYKKVNNPICKKKLKEIDKEFSIVFNNLERKEWGLLKLHVGKDNSYLPITYSFPDNSRSQIGCYYFTQQNSTILKVLLYDHEFRKIISKKTEKK